MQKRRILTMHENTPEASADSDEDVCDPFVSIPDGNTP